MEHYRPTQAEVNVFRFADNIKALKAYVGADTVLMAVVKGDAYGHGAEMLSRVALSNGAGCLGVALLEEALVLRRYGINAPILVMGALWEECAYQKALAEDIALCIYHVSQLEMAQRMAEDAGKTLHVHVKVETGFHRLGIEREDLLRFLFRLSDCPNVKLEGLFTHFGAADMEDGDGFVREQAVRFAEAEQLVREQGYDPIVHLCNSAATLRYPEFHRDMVRVGLSCYGHYGADFLKEYDVSLVPCMRLTAKIVRVHLVERGEGIGYGFTYLAERKRKVATLPIGYADGYPRSQSNLGEVLVKGKRCPVVGRICMDQMMIDVSEVNAEIGEEVVLFGWQGGEDLPVEELAERRGTISYEILTGISSRVYREYVYES